VEQDELWIAWIAGFPVGDVQSFDAQRPYLTSAEPYGVISEIFMLSPFAVEPSGARPLFRFVVLCTACWM